MYKQKIVDVTSLTSFTPSPLLLVNREGRKSWRGLNSFLNKPRKCCLQWCIVPPKIARAFFAATFYNTVRTHCWKCYICFTSPPGPRGWKRFVLQHFCCIFALLLVCKCLLSVLMCRGIRLLSVANEARHASKCFVLHPLLGPHGWKCFVFLHPWSLSLYDVCCSLVLDFLNDLPCV